MLACTVQAVKWMLRLPMREVLRVDGDSGESGGSDSDGSSTSSGSSRGGDADRAAAAQVAALRLWAVGGRPVPA